jgi:hypothetical protein
VRQTAGWDDGPIRITESFHGLFLHNLDGLYCPRAELGGVRSAQTIPFEHAATRGQEG